MEELGTDLDNWGNEDFEEKAIPAEKIEEFEELCRRSKELEAEIKAVEDREIKPRKSELHKVDMRILATMEHFQKKSYKPACGGMFVRTEKFSVKFPKDEDAKKELITFMGVDNFISMAQINFQTFNGYYKERMEEAIEKGQIDFALPGVEKPTYVNYLSKRAK